MNTAPATYKAPTDQESPARQPYRAPYGSDHHGRAYTSEIESILAKNPPHCATKVYLALITFSDGDRAKARIFASDEKLEARSHLHRRSVYTGIKWLECNGIIHREKIKGKRNILWGPSTPELVKPKVDHPDQKQMKMTRQAPANPPLTPAPALGLASEPKPAIRDNPASERKEAQKKLVLTGKIPVYTGDQKILPKGVDLVEYRQRIKMLKALNWYSDDQIINCIHYAPDVDAGWILAYRTTMESRPEIEDHCRLFEWHLAQSRSGKGVKLDTEPLKSARSTISLDRRYVEAEINGKELVVINTEERRQKSEQARRDSFVETPKARRNEIFADWRKQNGVKAKEQ